MVQALTLSRDAAIPAASVLTLDAGGLHVLLPPVILLSLSLALPAGSRRAMLPRAAHRRDAWPAPAGVLLLVQWSGPLALEIQATAEVAGFDRATPRVLSLLLPIVAGGLLAWWAARERRSTPQR